MTPQRIIRRRTKGWRLPAGALCVTRPGKYGNPFPAQSQWTTWTALALGYRADSNGQRAVAVELHRAWLTGTPIRQGPLAGTETGGAIEYDDGTVLTLTDHVSGIGAWMASQCEQPTIPQRPDLGPLRGHDLACYCPVGLPCHADTLIELANP